MRLVLLTIILLLCAVACAEKADLDPREKRLVNVECILREDSIQRLYLCYSSRVHESNYPPVEEAEAFIDEYTVDGNDSTRVARYAFSKVSDGKWESAFSPKVEHIYKLNVDVPGYPHISAKTTFSRGSYVAKYLLNEKNFRFAELGNDEKSSHGENSRDCAFCSIYIYSQYVGDELEPVDIHDSSAFWIYGMDFNPVNSKFEIAEYIYSCHAGADKFNRSNKTGSQLPQLQKPESYDTPDYMDCLEYGVPMYYSLINEYCSVADDFFNIRYIRIPISVFAKESLEDATVPYTVPVPENHPLISNYGSAVYVPCFNQYYKGIAHPYAHIVFEQVSADYDKYLKDVLSFHYGLDNKTEKDELTHLYDYREVYTNITNGTGIFGWSKRKMTHWANFGVIHYGEKVYTNKNYLNYYPLVGRYHTETIKEYYRKYGDPNIR